MYQLTTKSDMTQTVVSFATEEALWKELTYQGVPRALLGTGSYDNYGVKLTWTSVEAEYDKPAAEKPTEVYVVSVGEYEDETVVGVASSRSEAKVILDKARASVAYGTLAAEGSLIQGPFLFGELS